MELKQYAVHLAILGEIRVFRVNAYSSQQARRDAVKEHGGEAVAVFLKGEAVHEVIPAADTTEVTSADPDGQCATDTEE